MKLLKKVSAVILCLFMLVSAVSCTPRDPSAENTAGPDPSPTLSDPDGSATPETPADEPAQETGEEKDVPPAHGTVSVPGVAVSSAVNQTALLASVGTELPVVVNQYPYSHSGLGVELTDALKKSIEQRIVDFLALAGLEYSNYELVDIAIDDGIYYVDGINGDRMVAAGPHRVTASWESEEALSELAELEGDPFYSAALAYLGISEPIVQRYEEVNAAGAITEIRYVLYEAGETPLDTVLNRSFSCVEITLGQGYPQVMINVLDVPHGELADGQGCLSLEEAARSAGLTLSDDLVCEVVYDAEIRYGYYVPVYNFYTKEADGASVCQVVTVPAATD